MSRMSSQLMDVGIFPLQEHVVNHVSKRDKVMLFQTLQAQLVGFLPPSPHRMPRVQNHGDDEENAQVGKRFAGFAHAHLVPFLNLSLWFGGQRHLFLTLFVCLTFDSRLASSWLFVLVSSCSVYTVGLDV